MDSIETIICLILLLMGVPDLCRKFGRPALANAFFVVFGLLFGPLVEPDVRTMVEQVGEVGFLLVLFEVGLEIDLPKFSDFLTPLRFAFMWSLVNYIVVLALADAAGLNLSQGILAAAALSSCSLSMSYFGWKHYPGLDAGPRDFILQTMIALEVIAMVILSVGDVVAAHGFGWSVFLKLGGIAITIYLTGRFATHVVKLFQWIIERTTHWRVHFLVLLVLIISAIGKHLGLSAAKTAFFLGLFMSRAEFQGQSVEEYIAPISRRFLIPIFFVSLGFLIDVHMLFSYIALLALLGAILLIGFREMIHRRWFKTGGDTQAYLLLCPNLTMAALAVKTLVDTKNLTAASWVILSGLFLSVISLMLLPRETEADNKSPVTQNEAQPG
ncbi:MAG TPA: cation:proton antiporter [Verrucomicrobiae bacterium]|jgi:Kef-type K+ transport system membrane component KefB